MTKKEEKKALKERLDMLAKEPLRARRPKTKEEIERLKKAGWL